MSKQQVAEALAARVKDGDVIGIGSGSTVELALVEIGKRVKQDGLNVKGVPTSLRSAKVGAESGIEILNPSSAPSVSWAFDGADEVDPDFNMIKGNGAAMLSEKIMARRAGSLVIIVTEDKLVKSLGEKFALPIEVVPEAESVVLSALKELGAESAEVRMSSEKYGPLITEHGNIVIDAKIPGLSASHDAQLNALTGVVDTGLFVDLTQEVLVSKADGVYRLTPGKEEKISS